MANDFCTLVRRGRTAELVVRQGTHLVVGWG